MASTRVPRRVTAPNPIQPTPTSKPCSSGIRSSLPEPIPTSAGGQNRGRCQVCFGPPCVDHRHAVCRRRRGGARPKGDRHHDGRTTADLLEQGRHSAWPAFVAPPAPTAASRWPTRLAPLLTCRISSRRWVSGVADLPSAPLCRHARTLSTVQTSNSTTSGRFVQVLPPADMQVLLERDDDAMTDGHAAGSKLRGRDEGYREPRASTPGRRYPDLRLRRPVRRGYDGERLKTLRGFAAEASPVRRLSARSTASSTRSRSLPTSSPESEARSSRSPGSWSLRESCGTPRVREVLGTVQLDSDARIGAQQVDFQLALAIERNRERDIETESAFGFGECLEPPEEKRLRRAPESIDTVGVLGEPGAACTNRLASGVPLRLGPVGGRCLSSRASRPGRIGQRRTAIQEWRWLATRLCSRRLHNLDSGGRNACQHGDVEVRES